MAKYAVARLHGGPGCPDLRGRVCFRQREGGVLVTAEAFGLPCRNGGGIFALHIHEGRDCGGTDAEPFAGAGGHYNPAGTPHPGHAGDLPPLLGGRGGYAYLSVFTDRFTVADVLGRTVIVHGCSDDFVTQPAGNAGERIACGRIVCCP